LNLAVILIAAAGGALVSVLAFVARERRLALERSLAALTEEVDRLARRQDGRDQHAPAGRSDDPRVLHAQHADRWTLREAVYVTGG
jgi:hypothetical protein